MTIVYSKNLWSIGHENLRWPAIGQEGNLLFQSSSLSLSLLHLALSLTNTISTNYRMLLRRFEGDGSILWISSAAKAKIFKHKGEEYNSIFSCRVKLAGHVGHRHVSYRGVSSGGTSEDQLQYNLLVQNLHVILVYLLCPAFALGSLISMALVGSIRANHFLRHTLTAVGSVLSAWSKCDITELN